MTSQKKRASPCGCGGRTGVAVDGGEVMTMCANSGEEGRSAAAVRKRSGQNGGMCGSRGQTMCSAGVRKCEVGKEKRRGGGANLRPVEGTAIGRRKSRTGVLGHGCAHGHGHCAVVSAVTPAARGQACIVAARQQRYEGRKAEHTHKREAEEATHLSFIVHDA